jgi:hypothetical protein
MPLDSRAASDKVRQRRLWPGVAYCACTASLTFLSTLYAFAQQPCNPAIDGTYCATAGIRRTPQIPSTDGRKRDVGFGQTISGAGLYEQPATLGAITFGSAERCVGLIRRVSCKD